MHSSTWIFLTLSSAFASGAATPVGRGEHDRVNDQLAQAVVSRHAASSYPQSIVLTKRMNAYDSNPARQIQNLKTLNEELNRDIANLDIQIAAQEAKRNSRAASSNPFKKMSSNSINKKLGQLQTERTQKSSNIQRNLAEIERLTTSVPGYQRPPDYEHPPEYEDPSMHTFFDDTGAHATRSSRPSSPQRSSRSQSPPAGPRQASRSTPTQLRYK